MEEDVDGTAYYYMVLEGSLYVGIGPFGGRRPPGSGPGNIGSVIVEHGVMRFAVEKTVWGQKRDELRFPYIFTREDLSAEEPLATDWGGGYIWDPQASCEGPAPHAALPRRQGRQARPRGPLR